MTEQYAQKNINPSGGSVAFTATGGAPTLAVQPTTGLAVVNTELAAANVTIPRAADAGPNSVLSIVKSHAANTVTLNASAGDSIVTGAAGNVIADANGSLTLASGGSTNRWYVVESTV